MTSLLRESEVVLTRMSAEDISAPIPTHGPRTKVLCGRSGKRRRSSSLQLAHSSKGEKQQPPKRGKVSQKLSEKLETLFGPESPTQPVQLSQEQSPAGTSLNNTMKNSTMQKSTMQNSMRKEIPLRARIKYVESSEDENDIICLDTVYDLGSSPEPADKHVRTNFSKPCPKSRKPGRNNNVIIVGTKRRDSLENARHNRFMDSDDRLKVCTKQKIKLEDQCGSKLVSSGHDKLIKTTRLSENDQQIEHSQPKRTKISPKIENIGVLQSKHDNSILETHMQWEVKSKGTTKLSICCKTNNAQSECGIKNVQTKQSKQTDANESSAISLVNDDDSSISSVASENIQILQFGQFLNNDSTPVKNSEPENISYPHTGKYNEIQSKPLLASDIIKPPKSSKITNELKELDNTPSNYVIKTEIIDSKDNEVPCTLDTVIKATDDITLFSACTDELIMSKQNSEVCKNEEIKLVKIKMEVEIGVDTDVNVDIKKEVFDDTVESLPTISLKNINSLVSQINTKPNVSDGLGVNKTTTEGNNQEKIGTNKPPVTNDVTKDNNNCMETPSVHSLTTLSSTNCIKTGREPFQNPTAEPVLNRLASELATNTSESDFKELAEYIALFMQQLQVYNKTIEISERFKDPFILNNIKSEATKQLLKYKSIIFSSRFCHPNHLPYFRWAIFVDYLRVLTEEVVSKQQLMETFDKNIYNQVINEIKGLKVVPRCQNSDSELQNIQNNAENNVNSNNKESHDNIQNYSANNVKYPAFRQLVTDTPNNVLEGQYPVHSLKQYPEVLGNRSHSTREVLRRSDTGPIGTGTLRIENEDRRQEIFQNPLAFDQASRNNLINQPHPPPNYEYVMSSRPNAIFNNDNQRYLYPDSSVSILGMQKEKPPKKPITHALGTEKSILQDSVTLYRSYQDQMNAKSCATLNTLHQYAQPNLNQPLIPNNTTQNVTAHSAKHITNVSPTIPRIPCSTNQQYPPHYSLSSKHTNMTNQQYIPQFYSGAKHPNANTTNQIHQSQFYSAAQNYYPYTSSQQYQNVQPYMNGQPSNSLGPTKTVQYVGTKPAMPHYPADYSLLNKGASNLMQKMPQDQLQLRHPTIQSNEQQYVNSLQYPSNNNMYRGPGFVHPDSVPAPRSSAERFTAAPHVDQVRSSTSRDSGIMSPSTLSASPLFEPVIASVQSLNPKVQDLTIINGPCYVCKAKTTLKCTNCYKTYYCSYKCQKYNWDLEHQFTCKGNDTC